VAAQNPVIPHVSANDEPKDRDAERGSDPRKNGDKPMSKVKAFVHDAAAVHGVLDRCQLLVGDACALQV